MGSSARSGEVNDDREEEELPLCVVSRQILKPPFLQGLVSVRYYGQVVLLLETLAVIVERRCSMAERGVKEILPVVLFYIFITNLLAKLVSLPKHMLATSAMDAFVHAIHAWSDEPNKLTEPNWTT